MGIYACFLLATSSSSRSTGRTSKISLGWPMDQVTCIGVRCCDARYWPCASRWQATSSAWRRCTRGQICPGASTIGGRKTDDCDRVSEMMNAMNGPDDCWLCCQCTLRIYTLYSYFSICLDVFNIIRHERFVSNCFLAQSTTAAQSLVRITGAPSGIWDSSSRSSSSQNS
jgi:hypothetical protein